MRFGCLICDGMDETEFGGFTFHLLLSFVAGNDDGWIMDN
jgi:hypothetical protein